MCFCFTERALTIDVFSTPTDCHVEFREEQRTGNFVLEESQPWRNSEEPARTDHRGQKVPNRVKRKATVHLALFLTSQQCVACVEGSAAPIPSS